MFKFLKSKKGFTLVELMIVVVIMAILVAVAVPIYSAVTKNARTKTCIANMREIVSQVNTFCMSKQHSPASALTFTVSSDGDKGTITGGNEADTTLTLAAIKDLFQQVPGCPAKGTYTMIISAATGSEEAGGVKVTITCNGGSDKAADKPTDHVYGTAAAAEEE